MATRFEPYRQPAKCSFALGITSVLWVALVVAVALKTWG